MHGRHDSDWSDVDWLKAEADENKMSAARFSWFATAVPAVWTLIVATLIAMAWRREATLLGAACWFLALLSAWRYMEIRAKRLVEAYYFVIALNRSSVFNPARAEKKPD